MLVSISKKKKIILFLSLSLWSDAVYTFPKQDHHHHSSVIIFVLPDGLFACLGECFYPSSWSTECESKKTKNKIII
jgi:hypothetical protein